MFTFFAAIFGIKLVTEHQTEIIIGLIVIVGIIIFLIVRRRQNIRRYAILQQQRKEKEAAEAERKREEEKRKEEINEQTETTEEEQKIVYIPDEIEGKQRAYSYQDVVIEAAESFHYANSGDQLNLYIEEERISVKKDNVLIGYMPQSRLSDMVKDWMERNDPFTCYYSHDSESGPVVSLFFYADLVGRFLTRNPEAKLMKLTGKPEENAFYSKGKECFVEEDVETERFHVICDDSVIGNLPPTAITYAKKQNIAPEDLDIIIADVEYDIEKDRDIISVYVSE